jgi:3-oxoacyl-[acyl-carrier protein] reductase
MLASFTGRKTGRRYRQPLSYVQDGNALRTPGGDNWKLNLRDDETVRLRLRGRDVTAWPEVVSDLDEVERLLQVMTAANPSVGRFVGLRKRPEVESTASDSRTLCAMASGSSGGILTGSKGRGSSVSVGLHIPSSEFAKRKEYRMELLRGKIALVTGSSRGIGAAIAQLFAREGARVAVHGREAAALSTVKGNIVRAGGSAIEVFGDVTQFDQVEAMRSQIEDTLGPIDILVANAGGSFTMSGPIEETSEDGWRASVDGNLTATFLTIKSILPGMKQRKAGSIITISSAAGRRAHPQSPIPYSAAKAGIQILTQDVAAQAGPYGIRVNCIALETILTERNQQPIPEAQQRALADQHPLKRLGTPADVARAALFLVSDDAQWITGIVLDVAGGAVMS